jgi:acyl-homoserine lactone acylase PvdQ
VVRRAVALAALVLAAAPAVASADTELNVIPHGQHEPGVPWASQPGMLPANAQALMYDRLTPLGRNVTDAVLAPSADGTGYLKSAALLRPDDPSLITDQTISADIRGTTVTARIRRDAYGVPHVFSDSDDGVVMGAGYVIAEDRNLLLNQARDNGLAGALDIPGAPAIQLILGLYDYTPTPAVRRRVERQQERALRKAGVDGLRVLRDIDTYLVGLNLWYSENQPQERAFDRTDIYALNAVKAQFLGEGGGAEVANALFLDAARDALGNKTGARVYQDLRMRDDPETSTTTQRSAPHQTNVSATRPKGLVRLEEGSYRPAGVTLPGADASAAAAGVRPHQEASNVLLVDGERSATGTPIMVGGPQIGYNHPGLTMEIGLYGPTLRARGATSAPFPGYMLIGRGQDFAWTLTSAGADIIDTYAERLCRGSRTRYVYKGKCRKMKTVNAGTIAKGEDSVRVRYRETVHGPVVGYARVAGGKRVVALAQKRSSQGRETTDQIFFQRLSTGRVTNAQEFIDASKATPQTFNSFYADEQDIAFVTSGRLPIRRKGVNGDLPVDGRGSYEWRGFLGNARHPQDISPDDGLLVNWNNKPAKDFPAGDERWDEGGTQRVDWLLAELAKVPKHTPATVLGAANAGATADPRGLMWPAVKAVLDRGTAPSPLAAAVVDQITAWSAGDASWVDANGDGTIDAPGQAAIAAVWQPLAAAALCGRLGDDVCEALRTRKSPFQSPPSGMYGGWHQYLSKDLRTLLGQQVAGKFKVRYCGRGDIERCAADLWAAIQEGADAAAQTQGTADPAQWRTPTVTISFSPLPLADIQYTNRPSGIHQVMQFAP